MDIDETILHRLLDKGIQMGASYVEVRYQDDFDKRITLRNDKIIGITRSRERGIGIRVVVKGSLGFSSTNSLDFENLFKTLEYAISRARSISNLRKNPIEFSEDKPCRARYEVVEKKSLRDISIEEVVETLLDMYRSASRYVKEAKLINATSSLNTSIQEKVIATSDGGYVYSRTPRLHISMNNILLYQDKTIQRYRQFAGSGGFELVNEWKPSIVVEREIGELEKVLIKGIESPRDKIDVVLGPELVGLIVHESAGHPMEADRILGREAAQAGESYVKPDMIGRFKIGNRYATVIEDPTIPGSYGFYLYDDECIRARPRYLYREGLLNEPLHNRHTARLFKVSSNGAARAMNYASEPIIRMSNTFLAPGEESFEELIEDIELGIYVKSYMEWNIDDTRWNQRYVGLESYIIRNGEIAEPVRNPVLEFTTGWFYNNIVSVDRNLEFYPGTCGKGEPSQGVPVWFGGPNVKLSKMKIGVLM